MFIDNKYKKCYSAIISNAYSRELNDVYNEKHHILPQALYPEFADAKWNIVSLTAREHFICHLLLTKFTTGNSKHKMIYAANGLAQWHAKNQKRYVPNSRIYQSIKEEFSKTHSKKLTGRKLTEEHKANISAGLKAKKIKHSAETIEKRAAKLRGQKRSPEQCAKQKEAQKHAKRHVFTNEEIKLRGEKISKALKGKSKSEKHKEALSKSLTGKYLGVPKSEETKARMRKPKSEEHKKNMRKPKSPEHIKAIIEAKKKKKKLERERLAKFNNK